MAALSWGCHWAMAGSLIKRSIALCHFKNREGKIENVLLWVGFFCYTIERSDVFTYGHKQGGLWEGGVEVTIARGAESIPAGLCKGKGGLILHLHQIPPRSGRGLPAGSCHSSWRSINLVQLSNVCPWQKGLAICGFGPWEGEVTGSGRFSLRSAGTGEKEVGWVASCFSSAAAIVESPETLGSLQMAEEPGVALAAWSQGLNVGAARGLYLNSPCWSERAMSGRCSMAGTQDGSPGAQVLLWAWGMTWAGPCYP